jgi:hypothetical protein
VIEIYVIAAIALIAAGAAAGILVIFAMGIHREEKARSLGNANPGRIEGGLRVFTSAYAHPELPELTHRHRSDLTLTGQVRPQPQE